MREQSVTSIRVKLALWLLAIIVGNLLFAMVARAEVNDAALHFGFSTVIGLGSGVATMYIDAPAPRRATAFGLCMVPGIGKELADDKVSGKDLAFDALGCIAGITLFEGVEIATNGRGALLQGRF